MIYLLFLKNLMEIDVEPKAVGVAWLRQLTEKEELSQQWMLSWATACSFVDSLTDVTKAGILVLSSGCGDIIL